MRILFFSDNFKPETCPPAIHVYERAKIWTEWGHKVTVITTAPNFPEGVVFPGYTNAWRRIEQMDGIRVVRVKSFITANKGFLLRILDFTSLVAPAVLAALREVKPDVVISTSPQLFTPVAGLMYARLKRIPHVFELRDLWPASIVGTGFMKAGRLYRILERLELSLYRRSARIVSITRSFAADLISRGVPESKIDVVMSGTNLDTFKPRAKDQEIVQEYGLQGRFVIGYLGTLGIAHGLENALRAADLLRDTNIVFLFVGSGAAAQKLENLARDLDLRNVIFVDRHRNEDMPRFCSVCDLALVHLRNKEVFRTVIPTKVFDSMAMGIPILFVGPVGEGSTLVENHGAGIVVPPEDPVRLADAARSMAEEHSLRELCGRNGVEAAALYSRSRHAGGTLAVLERALSTERETAGVCASSLIR